MHGQNLTYRGRLFFLLAITSVTFAIACKRTTDVDLNVATNDPDLLLRQMSKKLAQANKLS